MTTRDKDGPSAGLLIVTGIILVLLGVFIYKTIDDMRVNSTTQQAQPAPVATSDTPEDTPSADASAARTATTDEVPDPKYVKLAHDKFEAEGFGNVTQVGIEQHVYFGLVPFGTCDVRVEVPIDRNADNTEYARLFYWPRANGQPGKLVPDVTFANLAAKVATEGVDLSHCGA